MKKNLFLAVLFVSLAANICGIAYITKMKSTTENAKTIEAVSPALDTLSEWNTLQLAIAMTESEFNPNAVGKTMDYGIYQITPIYVKEVNRLLGNQVYTHNQAFDIEKSVEMFNILQSYKNPDQDINKAIYYHNKADWYRKKVLKNYETVKRYETLRAVLQEYI
jgi:predicted CoA-binding protein